MSGIFDRSSLVLADFGKMVEASISPMPHSPRGSTSIRSAAGSPRRHRDGSAEQRFDRAESGTSPSLSMGPRANSGSKTLRMNLFRSGSSSQGASRTIGIDTSESGVPMSPLSPDSGARKSGSGTWARGTRRHAGSSSEIIDSKGLASRLAPSSSLPAAGAVAFVAGYLNGIDLFALAESLRRELDIRDRVFRLKTHANTFLAMDLIRYLIHNRIVANHADALEVGERLITSGLIFDVLEEDEPFKGGYRLYRFAADERELNEQELDIPGILQTLRERIRPRDRRQGLVVVEDCFLGVEVVRELMASQMAASRPEAQKIAQKLEDQGLLVKAKGKDMVFVDGVCCYRFNLYPMSTSSIAESLKSETHRSDETDTELSGGSLGDLVGGFGVSGRTNGEMVSGRVFPSVSSKLVLT
ncbi:DEP domain-containing mTOR-interacting protein [Porphyridium purpureum]|uniref:DEP domain-containing mTOR-interacting protein n=1 Tax=Porphyridium purpureum TaxID=35688 RepID=A0A5J4YVG7_PORPP|nr:DEP domain-containing mTOR-interacting protein [Porphyridium purpureum]|eukprot:POR3172..scf209_3